MVKISRRPAGGDLTASPHYHPVEGALRREVHVRTGRRLHARPAPSARDPANTCSTSARVNHIQGGPDYSTASKAAWSRATA